MSFVFSAAESDKDIVAISNYGQEVKRRNRHLFKETIRFVFHKFKELPDQPSQIIEPAAVWCHGCRWSLRLYPGGKGEGCEHHVSVFLKCTSSGKHGGGPGYITYRVPSAGHVTNDDEMRDICDGSGYGWKKWISRADILDPSKGFLVDDKLIIDIDISMMRDEALELKPKSTLQQDMFKMLNTADESGDVEFLVENKSFFAHRAVLQVRAPYLAELVEDYPPKSVIPLHECTTASIFHAMLVYIYTDQLPDNMMQREAKNILDVADRYGCQGLKILAEAELIENGINIHSAADMVLFSDARNCAILKEVAIQFVAANLSWIKSTAGWNNLVKSESLLNEIMDVLAGKTRPALVSTESQG